MQKEKIIPTFEHAEIKCPGCGHGFTREANVTGGGPRRGGDLSVCYYCACFMKHTKNGLKLLTESDCRKLGLETLLRLEMIATRILEQRRHEKTLCE